MIDTDRLGLGKWQKSILTMATTSGSFFLNDMLPNERGECWSQYCSLHRAAISLHKLKLIEFQRGIVYLVTEER